MQDDKKYEKPELEKLQRQTSSLVYGTSQSQLKEKDKELQKLINDAFKKTTSQNIFPFTNKPMEYISKYQLFDLKNSLDGKRKVTNAHEEAKQMKEFKNILERDVFRGVDTNTPRNIVFSNYRHMATRITELYNAKKIYADAILSPDVFSRTVFKISYKGTTGDDYKVNDRVMKLIDKYDFYNKTKKIIDEFLITGTVYALVVSINDELSKMLDRGGRILTEDLSVFDAYYTNHKITVKDINLENNEKESFKNLLESNNVYRTYDNKLLEGKEFTDEQVLDYVKNSIEKNVIIKSKLDVLKEELDILAEQNIYKTKKSLLTEEMMVGEVNTQPESEKDINMYLNGSDILLLPPEKIIPLKINSKIIGYYHIEKMADEFGDPMLGPAMKGMTDTFSNLGGMFSGNDYGNNGIYQGVTKGRTFNDNTYTKNGPIDIEKIANVFLKGIAKKVDKQFIKNNKEFKELIYSLIKEKYLINKKVAFTFYSADDIIALEEDSMFAGGEWMAKLYLTELTNHIVASVGRAHDKRVIKIPISRSNETSNTIQEMVREWKAYEFTMGDVEDSSISTLVRQSFGRFEDIAVPIKDGQQTFEIDTLPGMDTNKSTELLEWLKNSLLNIFSLPQNMLAGEQEVDYARTLALRNVNFGRDITNRQASINPVLTQIIRKLYINEYKYVGNTINKEDINPYLIIVELAKPTALVSQALTENINIISEYVDKIAEIKIYAANDPKNSFKVHKFKEIYIQKLMGGIDWNEIEGIINQAEVEATKQKIKHNTVKNEEDAWE